MENKKLLGYILKDLMELEEMFDEKTCLQFDEIETEFIQNRVKSARKLVQLYIGHPVEKTAEPLSAAVSVSKIDEVEEPVKVVHKPETPVLRDEHQPVQGVIVNGIMEYLEDTITEIAEEDGENMPEAEEEDEWQQPEPEKSFQTKKAEVVLQELRLDETPDDDQQNKRLGDSFLKEKSVNDLISADAQKLENKISNMPVSSIQAAVGINDRFQYIRELFDGDADKFAETVAKLDSMSDLKDAVVYLQQNFKWKKTEVSLKFVTLIKRRFPQ